MSYTTTSTITRTTNETQVIYTLPNSVSLPGNPGITSGGRSCPGVPPDEVPPQVPGMIYLLYGYCNPNEYWTSTPFPLVAELDYRLNFTAYVGDCLIWLATTGPDPVVENVTMIYPFVSITGLPSSANVSFFVPPDSASYYLIVVNNYLRPCTTNAFMLTAIVPRTFEQAQTAAASNVTTVTEYSQTTTPPYMVLGTLPSIAILALVSGVALLSIMLSRQSDSGRRHRRRTKRTKNG